jgi:hypothetical protein
VAVMVAWLHELEERPAKHDVPQKIAVPGGAQ